MYTDINFKTKKALKEAVAAWCEAHDCRPGTVGSLLVSLSKVRPVRVFQPGPFAGNEPSNGEVSVEGPHFPQPHRWYARVQLRDGLIVKVR